MESAIPFIPGPRQYRIEIVSEGSYQNNLNELCGRRRQEQLRIQTRAHLVRDDDAGPGVEVSIKGQLVGHLSVEQTEALDRIIRYGARSPYQTFECAALIHGTSGHLGVRLDLALDSD